MFEGGCTCRSVRYRFEVAPLIVHCKVAVFSHYSGGGDAFAFVRVGTLDEPDRLPPDVHIFTMSKQPWVVLPDGAKAFHEFYNAKEVWPKESLARWAKAKS